MGGDKTTTPRRPRGQVRHFMLTCLSTKLPPLPVPSELEGQQWSLKGRGGKKSTWQCHFYNNTAFSVWNTVLMGQNNKITLFFLVHVCGLMPAGPHWVVLGCSILGNVTSSCLGVDPQGFPGMSGAHLHGAPSPALGAVGALELRLELSTVLPHPLCPSWEDVRPFLMALL